MNEDIQTQGIALALIGGTGLYALEGIEVDRQFPAPATPWGEPSGPVTLGSYAGRGVLFLARHGEHHHLAPHQVNYRANLWWLHQLGARTVLGINSVGGMDPELPPGTLALPHQLVDYTWGRAGSYGGEQGRPVAHIDFARPYSEPLRQRLFDAARRADVALREGGCYACTQGPRLETAAEIARLQRDGCALVGMTGMPEAALARELEMDYACLAVVANWAAGRDPDPHPHPITIEEVRMHVRNASAGIAPLLRALLEDVP